MNAATNTKAVKSKPVADAVYPSMCHSHNVVDRAQPASLTSDSVLLSASFPPLSAGTKNTI